MFFLKLYYRKMWLLGVKKSDRKDKRYKATFCKCKEKNACKGTNHKEVHFGQEGAQTYIDGAPDQKKDAYIARHSKSPGEDWSKPDTPGALSRFLLWSKRSLREAIDDFKKKFKV